MRELEITLLGNKNLSNTVVYVDDEPVTFKKKDSYTQVGRFQTENDTVNIRVCKMLDVGGFFWFLTQLFFFIITIFGIFDIHHRERCMVIDFEAEVDLREENKLTLQFGFPKENDPAIIVQSDLTRIVLSNQYVLDVRAKKILKILKLTKIFLTLAIIAIAIAVLMLKLR